MITISLTPPSAAICGLVIGADKYLLKYEYAQREAENAMRREARNALAKKGIIATETEIRRWKAERAAEIAETDALIAEAEAALAGKPVEVEFEHRKFEGAVAKEIKARSNE